MFRQELKYQLTEYNFGKHLEVLQSAGFSQPYPARTVNSLYFDNDQFQMYADSEEGVLPRKKTRIRWYDDRQETSFLETKISSPEGRFKTVVSIDEQTKVIKRKDGIKDMRYGLLKPALYVCYWRQYFVVDKVRITLDTDISYRRNFDDCSLEHFDLNSVLELKCDFDFPVWKLDALIPFPTTRFSKYCNGIRKVKGF